MSNENGIILKAQHGILVELCTDSISSESDAPIPVVNLDSQIKNFSQSFSLQAFAITEEDLAELLTSHTDATQQANHWKKWWLKHLANLNATLFDNASRDNTFLRKALKPTFDRFDPDMRERKIDYENYFRHGYIYRFGQLVLEYLKKHRSEFSEHDERIFKAWIEQANSNIYDIVLGMTIHSGLERNLSFYNRLFDFCAHYSFQFLPYEISNIPEFIKENYKKTIDALMEGDESSFTISRLDPNFFWRKWIRRKIPEVVRFFLETDKLTEKNHLNLISDKLGETISFSMSENIIVAFISFYLGKFAISVGLEDADCQIYVSKLTSALEEEFLIPSNELRLTIKKELMKQQSLLILREKLGKPAAKEETCYPILKKLTLFLDKKFSMIANASEKDLLTLLQSVSDFLFSMELSSEIEHQKFFISLLMEEQIKKEDSETLYDFYNAYQSVFFTAIIEEAIKRYRSVGIGGMDYATIQTNFLRMKKIEHQEKSLQEIRMLFDLASPVFDMVDLIDESDGDSLSLKQGLQSHFKSVEKKYAAAYSEKNWLPPAAKHELIKKTSLSQIQFMKDNEKLNVDPKLKSRIYIVLNEFLELIKAMFFKKSASLAATQNIEARPSIQIISAGASVTPLWQRTCATKYEEAAKPFILIHPPLVHTPS